MNTEVGRDEEFVWVEASTADHDFVLQACLNESGQLDSDSGFGTGLCGEYNDAVVRECFGGDWELAENWFRLIVAPALVGAKGGKAKTAKKAASSANNGKRGGRPTLFQQMKEEVIKKWGSDKWMPGSSSFRHTEIMLEASSATVKRWEKEGLIELRGMMYVLTQKGYNS